MTEWLQGYLAGIISVLAGIGVGLLSYYIYDKAS